MSRRRWPRLLALATLLVAPVLARALHWGWSLLFPPDTSVPPASPTREAPG